MVTQKNIADELGLSVAAVSKALSDSSDVSDEVKTKVKEVAARLGYVPNATARALRSHKSKLIGLLYSGIEKAGLSHEFFSYVMDSFRKEAEKEGYSVIFLQETPSMDYLDMVHYWDMDAVAVLYCDFARPSVKRLIASDIPMVVLNFHFSGKISVQSNSYYGEKDLIQRLYRGGYRKFALIEGEGGARAPVFKERVYAYYATLKELGLSSCDEEACKAYDPMTSLVATKKILERTKPDVLVYTDDVCALSGIIHLKTMGITPKKDIGVVGFGGMRMSRLSNPVLTSYVLAQDSLGITAAAELIKWLKNPNSYLPKRFFIDGTFQEGDTARTD
mgnify:FL=1